MSGAERCHGFAVGFVANFVEHGSHFSDAQLRGQVGDTSRRFHQSVVRLDHGQKPPDMLAGSARQVFEPGLHVNDHVKCIRGLRDELSEKATNRGVSAAHSTSPAVSDSAHDNESHAIWGQGAVFIE